MSSTPKLALSTTPAMIAAATPARGLLPASAFTFRQRDEPGIVGEALERGRRSAHEEQIADAERYPRQPFLDGDTVLLDGDHRRIEALGEVQIAEGAAHETRSRRHENLDQAAAPALLVEFMLLPFPRRIEPLPPREIEEALCGPLHVQDVARPNVAVSVRRGDLLFTPFDVQHRDPVAFAPPQLGQRAAVRGRILRNVQFRDEAADVVPGGKVRRLEPPRQQHAAGGEEK